MDQCLAKHNPHKLVAFDVATAIVAKCEREISRYAKFIEAKTDRYRANPEDPAVARDAEMLRSIFSDDARCSLSVAWSRGWSDVCLRTD